MDKSEQAREKERKQIEAYKQLEKDVVERVCMGANRFKYETILMATCLDQSARLLQRNPPIHLPSPHPEP